MNQRLHLVTLGVRDFEKSKKFYEETLGWKPAIASSDDVAFFQAGGVVFAIYPREKLAEDALTSAMGSGFAGFTLAHNAKSESEVDEIIAEITQQVQAEVRSTPKVPATQADGTGNPGRTNELLDPEAQHSAIAEPPAQKPFMPNTFTPNNDGVNDDYRISMVGYTSMLLRVYSLKDNRLVFSTNTGEPWTGANCEDGMYLVAVEAMTATGQLVSEGKVVWLNRNGMN